MRELVSRRAFAFVRFHALRYGGIHAPAAHSTAIVHARRAFGESRVGSPRLLAVARRRGSDGRFAPVVARAGIVPGVRRHPAAERYLPCRLSNVIASIKLNVSLDEVVRPTF